MRLAGQEKMGFYPTPNEELEKIVSFLSIQDGVSVMDPCAGDGRALQAFKDKSCRTYGIEIEKTKYESIKKEVEPDSIINADAINEAYFKGKVDLLFLNPPYDFDVRTEDEFKTSRLETKFLKKYTKALRAGGVIIYIVPRKSIEKDWNFLSSRFNCLGLYRFKDEIYNQYVFIGEKGSGFGKQENLVVKDFKPIGKSISVIASDSDFLIYTYKIDPEKAVKCMDDELDKVFLVETTPNSLTVQPVTDVREGHLALLIASGMVDGAIERNAEKVYVKGLVSVRKEERVEVDDDGENEEKQKKIITYTPSVTVKVIKNNKLYELF